MNGTNSSGIASPINNGTDRLGWTSAPNNRGTMDIIWGCLLTLFLCCWSIMVVNVPAPGSRTQHLLGRKLLLVGLYALAPEIIFQVALSQWILARQSVALFHDSGYHDWTIKHGYYANMGGLHFQAAGWKSFPIDAKQLHYLVTREYVEYPHISADQIRDKNKVDGMLRFITLMQTLWFVINVVARLAQGLTVTALELSTVAFVWLGVATSAAWIGKPADVQYSDVIKSTKTMEEILIAEGDSITTLYHNTPLDFVSRKEWAWSKMWAHGLNILRKLQLAGPPVQRPISRFQNTVTTEVAGRHYLLFMFVSITYFAVFIAGWNLSFPTEIESVLWRVASLTGLATALSVCFIMHLCCEWYPSLKAKLHNAVSDKADVLVHIEPVLSNEKKQKQKKWYHRLASHLRNNSLGRDPAFDTSLTVIASTWFIGVFYCASRTYIVIADFMELRSLPADAYQDVDWSVYWPHF